MEEFIEQAVEFAAAAPEDVAVVMEIADLNAVAAARPRLSGWAAAKKDVFDWAGRQGNRVWSLILRGRMGLQGAGKLRKVGRGAIKLAAVFVVQPWVNSVVINKAVPALIRFNKREEARMVRVADKVRLGGAMKAMWAPNRWLMKVLDEHATKWWMLPVLGIPGAAAVFAMFWFAGNGAKRALRGAVVSLAVDVVWAFVVQRWFSDEEGNPLTAEQAQERAAQWTEETLNAYFPDEDSAAAPAPTAPTVVDGTVVPPAQVAPIDQAVLNKLVNGWGNLQNFKIVKERPTEVAEIQGLLGAASKHTDYHRTATALTNEWLPEYLWENMTESYTAAHDRVMKAVGGMKGDYVLTTAAARVGCTTDDIVATAASAIVLRNRIKISNSDVAKHLRLAVESAYVLQETGARLSDIRAKEEQDGTAAGTSAA